MGFKSPVIVTVVQLVASLCLVSELGLELFTVVHGLLLPHQLLLDAAADGGSVHSGRSIIRKLSTFASGIK